MDKIKLKYINRKKKEILGKCNHDNICSCKKDFLFLVKKIQANIPLRYIELGFRDITHIQVKKAKQVIMQYIKDYKKNVDSGIGLYLYGETGLGKTALGILVLSHMIKMRKNVYYIESSELIELFTESWNKYGLEKEDTELDFKNKIFYSDFLMIDNLGQEIQTKINTKVLEKIIRYRTNNLLPTVFSSKLSIKEFCMRYSSAEYEILYSLLSGTSKEIGFKGVDYRKVIIKDLHGKNK